MRKNTLVEVRDLREREREREMVSYVLITRRKRNLNKKLTRN